MKTMTYSATRANFAAAIDSVLEDREEVVITRAGKEPSSCSHSMTTSR